MKFHKLSFKNIQKCFKDYAIYFFTLILGVAIFYVFNAIDSQTVLLNTQSYVYELIKMMANMLSGVSVFVSVVLGFLIIYASRFLIKRRHKEFGIYMLLGMSKRKISMILFFETLFIGILSLGVGLILGVVLSQFMSILVANMFEADMTNFTFIVSKSAIVKTLIYFGIMYFLVDGLFDGIVSQNAKLKEMYDLKGRDISILEFTVELKKYLSEILGHEITYLREARDLRDQDVVEYHLKYDRDAMLRERIINIRE